MKSILMSIKPKWVEKIASREKTVEVRKTAPKCGTPFKVYMYCTYGRPLLMRSFFDGKSLFKFSGISNKNAKVIYDEELWNGKVVGEFVCDEILPVEVLDTGAVRNYHYYHLEQTNLSIDDIAKYIGKNKVGYALHISDLKIYDEPKELSEFRKNCDCFVDCLSCKRGKIGDLSCKGNITRPPQSWCYVEEI